MQERLAVEVPSNPKSLTPCARIAADACVQLIMELAGEYEARSGGTAAGACTRANHELTSAQHVPPPPFAGDQQPPPPPYPPGGEPGGQDDTAELHGAEEEEEEEEEVPDSAETSQSEVHAAGEARRQVQQKQ